eukprot:symbB.v1.2.009901.t1/scaffold605.1/size182108/1
MAKQGKAKEGMPSTQPFVYQLTVSENNTQIRSIVIPWNTTMTMAQNIVLKLQYRNTFIDATVEEDTELETNGGCRNRTRSMPPLSLKVGNLLPEHGYLKDLTQKLQDRRAKIPEPFTEPFSKIPNLDCFSHAIDLPSCGEKGGGYQKLRDCGSPASVSTCVESDLTPECPPSPKSFQLLPSPGTLGHPEVCRRPCMHFQLGHCVNGTACNFCHAVHPEKSAKLDKRQRMLLQGMNNQEFTQMVLQFLHQRLENSGGSTKVAAQDLVQCLEQKAADIPCPELPELWLKFSERDSKNLHKTFTRMNISNLIGVLTHKISKSVDEDRFVEAISCAMEKVRWHFLNEED